MWGTLHRYRLQRPARRFIPTHVGNTPPLPAPAAGTAVHPHACGEHALVYLRRAHNTGSSPRMWGTHAALAGQDIANRFIPTHVGNTPLVVGQTGADTVHPHACGEHVMENSATPRCSGSSPRMWGTLFRNGSAYPRQRFIPTHVGNTQRHKRMQACFAVHPHACGEHFAAICSSRTMAGSSPRMWGTLKVFQRRDWGVRFIPTHVGNTVNYNRTSIHMPVHPHACGEHAMATLDSGTWRGSSPRMWGTRSSLPARCKRRRFIPTHVGNTFHLRALRPPAAVHPHACGEHAACAWVLLAKVGSSPRMWGTRILNRQRPPASRFIPTHVGNTFSYRFC
ncbi:Domain of uncharacterised function (DUF2825) [Chromobacterium violaceum]|uniref:Domain of uncharacterized function (DUF2825) n=1 Tax=Chromobacterium violaceum TaxID=536 RepID=A0AAX2MBH6_CHRVL|nr:Domain of uncharacterised function (DUF2825) [Chromobacterium violaceum]SUX33519.1 Domain of uncharacterised function (DUF2825) [Chromobacterium violaceum]